MVSAKSKNSVVKILIFRFDHSPYTFISLFPYNLSQRPIQPIQILLPIKPLVEYLKNSAILAGNWNFYFIFFKQMALQFFGLAVLIGMLHICPRNSSVTGHIGCAPTNSQNLRSIFSH